MNWQDLSMSMLVAAGLYGGWKAISLLIAREQQPHARKLLRYVWPSLMLAWSWLMLIATTFPVFGVFMGRGLDFLLAVFFTVNLPGAYLGNLALALLINQPDWVKASVASAVVWITWYVIIRVWEWWRKWQGESRVPGLGL